MTEPKFPQELIEGMQNAGMSEEGISQTVERFGPSIANVERFNRMTWPEAQAILRLGCRLGQLPPNIIGMTLQAIDLPITTIAHLDDDSGAMVVVAKEHIQRWSVTPDEVFGCAAANTERRVTKECKQETFRVDGLWAKSFDGPEASTLLVERLYFLVAMGGSRAELKSGQCLGMLAPNRNSYLELRWHGGPEGIRGKKNACGLIASSAERFARAGTYGICPAMVIIGHDSDVSVLKAMKTR